MMKSKITELTHGWKGRIDFKIDDREQYRPGYKFNEWEKKGIPIRIEIGPKDIENNQVVLVRRDSNEKTFVSQDGLLERVEQLLETMQQNMFNRALEHRDANTHDEDNFESFKERIEDPGGFFWVHWCGSESCENKFQESSKATIRLIPTDEHKKEEGSCIVCGKSSHSRVLVAKSY
jgi:prolyl-tRNA synthetase